MDCPRLCRVGSKSLTFSGVSFAPLLLDLKKPFRSTNTCTSTSTLGRLPQLVGGKVIVDAHVLVDAAVDGFWGI